MKAIDYAPSDARYHPKLFVRRIALLATIGLITCYLCGYFFSSEIYLGKFMDEAITVRLFHHPWQLQLYQPLLFIEKHLRRTDFSGQIQNGASLPPPANG